DLDGDGDADAVAAAGLDHKIAWYENTDGAGAFGPEQVLTLAAVDATSVWAADLDGDTDADVLASSSGDDTIAWFENLGSGVFGSEQIIATTADGAFTVQAHDLDGDTDLDVLSGSFNDDKVAWYENDGAGNFGGENVITTLADFYQGMSVADLDGDGDRDVLSASPFDDKLAWYENDGAGAFGPQIVITAAVDSAQSVFAADLDGDTDRDLLAGWFNTGIGWFENVDGQGTFVFVSLISSQVLGLEMVYGADLDGDGDVDAVTASAHDDKIAWYENTDGAGAFGGQQVISTAAGFAQSVVAADVDGDLDLDLASASLDDDKAAWYENLHCAGTLASSEVIRAGTPPNPVAFLPGVTSGPVVREIWDPVIDHSAFLPGAIFDFAAITLAPLNLPFPPYGTLLCDVVTFPPIVFSGPAGVPFSIPVPNQCNLVGATLCSQGLSGNGVSLLLTNALDFTIGTL
ncbi:MAG: VCBS repeat-containing protein, partial [Actinobacteria bacterium]|nr:VCBS repeat-containing protein [Actinomycetota bacterium]